MDMSQILWERGFVKTIFVKLLICRPVSEMMKTSILEYSILQVGWTVLTTLKFLVRGIVCGRPKGR